MSDTPLHKPYDTDIEQALLGGLMRDNALIDVAAAEIDASQFYDPLHARIFQAVVEVSAVGHVTPVLLKTRMRTDPAWEDLEGGDGYLDDLRAAAPAAPDVRDYCRWIKEYSARRELQAIAEDLSSSVYEAPTDSPAQAIADQAVDRLLQIGRSQRPIVSPYETALGSIREIESIARGDPIPRIPTGFDKLDAEIGGFRGGDLTVVMAASGQGKSAWLGSCAIKAVMRGHPAIFFSLEMTRKQVVERILCDLDYDTAPSPMWYSRFRNGALSASEFTRAGAAAQLLHGLPLDIHDDDDLNIQQISARARAFSAKHGRMGLVLIDYLQIVAPISRREGNREQEVAAIARGAKSLAKRLNWPVMAGSQINQGRDFAAGKERPPTLFDARESKAIGNEADIVLSPWREAYYIENQRPRNAGEGDQAMKDWRHDMETTKNKMGLLCLKNRHGRRFELDLWCEMAASAIRDREPLRSVLGTSDTLQF